MEANTGRVRVWLLALLLASVLTEHAAEARLFGGRGFPLLRFFGGRAARRQQFANELGFRRGSFVNPFDQNLQQFFDPFQFQGNPFDVNGFNGFGGGGGCGGGGRIRSGCFDGNGNGNGFNFGNGNDFGFGNGGNFGANGFGNGGFGNGNGGFVPFGGQPIEGGNGALGQLPGGGNVQSRLFDNPSAADLHGGGGNGLGNGEGFGFISGQRREDDSPQDLNDRNRNRGIDRSECATEDDGKFTCRNVGGIKVQGKGDTIEVPPVDIASLFPAPMKLESLAPQEGKSFQFFGPAKPTVMQVSVSGELPPKGEKYSAKAIVQLGETPETTCVVAIVPISPPDSQLGELADPSAKSRAVNVAMKRANARAQEAVRSPQKCADVDKEALRKQATDFSGR